MRSSDTSDPASAATANSSISIDEVLPTILTKAGLGGTSVVIGFSEVCLVLRPPVILP